MRGYDDWKINGNWHYCERHNLRWSDSDGGCDKCDDEIYEWADAVLDSFDEADKQRLVDQGVFYKRGYKIRFEPDWDLFLMWRDDIEGYIEYVTEEWDEDE